MTLADDLGNVQARDLSFNQDAIAAFIEEKVPADDMGFSGMLNTMTVGSRAHISEMSPSQKLPIVRGSGE